MFLSIKQTAAIVGAMATTVAGSTQIASQTSKNQQANKQTVQQTTTSSDNTNEKAYQEATASSQTAVQTPAQKASEQTTTDSKVYVVKTGDTLSQIAEENGVSVNALIAANNDSSLIYAGQTFDLDAIKNGTNAQSETEITSTATALTDKQTQTSSTNNSAQTKAADTTSATQEQVFDTTDTNAGTAKNTNGNVLASNTGITQNSSSTASSSVATQKSATSTATASSSKQTTTSNNTSATQTSKTATASTTTTSSSSKTASATIQLAKTLTTQNIPYVWGGSNPSTGFDCSGLMAYIFKNGQGVTLPHNTVLQEAYFTNKPVSQAQVGDVLFWGEPGKTWHDAIYIGNNQYIAAPAPGYNVRVETIDPAFMPSFAGSYKG